MREIFYRSGQAARQLAVSAHIIRRLCEKGLIKAEHDPGGQWRLPASEIDRLKKEGIPPLPLVDKEPASIVPRLATPAIMPARLPSSAVAPVVQDARNSVDVKKARLDELTVDLELDLLVEERRRRKAALVAEEQRIRDQAAADLAEQERLLDLAIEADIQADQEREIAARRFEETRGIEDRIQQLTDYGISKVPHGSNLNADVAIAVQHALRKLNPIPGDARSIVDSVVAQILEPYYQGRMKEAVFEDALRPLWRAENSLKTAAADAVRKAVDRSRSASKAELISLANSAVQPFLVRHERALNCEKVLADVSHGLGWGTLRADSDSLREAASCAMAAAPSLSDYGSLLAVARQATEPVIRSISERRKAEELVDASLSSLIFSELDKWDFRNFSEKNDARKSIEEELRLTLVRRLVEGRIAQSDIPRVVRRTVDAHLSA